MFPGPQPAFVPTQSGAFAYTTTGTTLEAYARATRGKEDELVLRYGSLFLGWKTTGLGGEDALQIPANAPLEAAGRHLALGGFPAAWEQYEVGAMSVKHNVWLASAPPTSSAFVEVRGDLTLPANATISVDGQPATGSFDKE